MSANKRVGFLNPARPNQSDEILLYGGTSQAIY